MKDTTTLQKEVDDFNADHPVGTPVLRYPIMNPKRGEPQQTKTSSEAWVMGGHSAMVMVENHSGGVDLNSITVMEG